MPLVLLQTQPQPLQIPFVSFEDGQKMRTREQEHAGNMVSFVVALRARTDLTEARCRQ